MLQVDSLMNILLMTTLNLADCSNQGIPLYLFIIFLTINYTLFRLFAIEFLATNAMFIRVTFSTGLLQNT